MSFSLSGAHFPRVERPYRLPTCISRLEAQRGPQRDGGAAHRRGHGFASAAAAVSFPAAPRSRPAASQPERATRARRARPAALRGSPTREEPPSGPPEAVTSGVAAPWPQRSPAQTPALAERTPRGRKPSGSERHQSKTVLGAARGAPGRPRGGRTPAFNRPGREDPLRSPARDGEMLGRAAGPAGRSGRPSRAQWPACRGLGALVSVWVSVAVRCKALRSALGRGLHLSHHRGASSQQPLRATGNKAWSEAGKLRQEMNFGERKAALEQLDPKRTSRTLFGCLNV
ncbi:uncharacterized protein [Manis javanica]|uniref:uncharacterized protein n=1 Tax=Manis javanica TaxID=9974 RepID=UPI003C6D372E